MSAALGICIGIGKTVYKSLKINKYKKVYALLLHLHFWSQSVLGSIHAAFSHYEETFLFLVFVPVAALTKRDTNSAIAQSDG